MSNVAFKNHMSFNEQTALGKLWFLKTARELLFLPLDLRLEYRIGHVIIIPFYAKMCIHNYDIFAGEFVPCLAINCSCSVWCHGLTKYRLYIGPLLGNQVDLFFTYIFTYVLISFNIAITCFSLIFKSQIVLLLLPSSHVFLFPIHVVLILITVQRRTSYIQCYCIHLLWNYNSHFQP